MITQGNIIYKAFYKNVKTMVNVNLLQLLDSEAEQIRDN